MSPELRFRTQRVNLKLMTQQSGGSYVDNSVGSQTNGYQTDAERFPDPKRNWKRTGSLLGGWVLTLVAVFVFGLVWHNVLSAVVQNDYSEQQVDGDTAVRLYLKATFQERDAAKASQYLCGGDYDGPSPEEIVEEVEASPMGRPGFSATGGTATVNFKNGGPFDERTYLYIVEEAGSGSCIMSLQEQETK